MYLKRNNNSYKGQNGKVCVIGGSEIYHGAPIYTALGAEVTGVDLVYPIVPYCNREVTKHASYNFICHYFKLDYITGLDIVMINDVLDQVDTVVIGPGLSKKSLPVLKEIIQKISIPLVIDATALYAVKDIYETDEVLPPNTVITPHRGEFELFERYTKTNISKVSKTLECVVLVKGEQDIISNPEDIMVINKTGNPGLTVGGTGDLLSGMISGFIAQNVSLIDACKISVEILGKAGERLYKTMGYSYQAIDLLKILPGLIKKTCYT